MQHEWPPPVALDVRPSIPLSPTVVERRVENHEGGVTLHLGIDVPQSRRTWLFHQGIEALLLGDDGSVWTDPTQVIRDVPAVSRCIALQGGLSARLDGLPNFAHSILRADRDRTEQPESGGADDATSES